MKAKAKVAGAILALVVPSLIVEMAIASHGLPHEWPVDAVRVSGGPKGSDGKVTVEHLAEHFGVTHQTVRRDLTELAEAGRRPDRDCVA